MIRKLRPKQRGPRCSYCEDRAVWRGKYFSWLSCNAEVCREQLRDAERSIQIEDSYQTDAEFRLGVGEPS